jgi:hypothetical protein
MDSRWLDDNKIELYADETGGTVRVRRPVLRSGGRVCVRCRSVLLPLADSSGLLLGELRLLAANV